MVYKPEVIRTGGVYGVCKLKMSDDGKKLLIKFTKDKTKDNDDVKTQKFIVAYDKEHSPKYAKKLADGETTYRCNINQDGTKLYSLSPVKGLYRVKVKNFVAKNKQLVPAVNVMWGYQHFSVVFEIIAGSMTGVPITHNFHYNFGEKKGNVAFTHPQSEKYTIPLMDFCNASGIWDRGPIKYSDNILPELEKRCLQAEKEFEVVVKEGRISSIITDAEPMNDDTSEDKEEDAEELPWDDENTEE